MAKNAAAKYAKKARNKASHRSFQKPYGSRNLNTKIGSKPIHTSTEPEDRQVQSSFASRNQFDVLVDSEGKDQGTENLEIPSIKGPK